MPYLGEAVTFLRALKAGERIAVHIMVVTHHPKGPYRVRVERDPIPIRPVTVFTLEASGSLSWDKISCQFVDES